MIMHVRRTPTGSFEQYDPMPSAGHCFRDQALVEYNDQDEDEDPDYPIEFPNGGEFTSTTAGTFELEF
jgi:hypothetical protein